MMKKPTILICDDDETFQLALRHYLKEHFDIKTAFHGDEALAIIKNQSIDLLLLDVQMRSKTEGLDYIPKLKEVDPELMIVMSSGIREFDTVREAMKRGAIDYIPKDAEPEDLHHSLKRVLEKKTLLQKHEQAQAETKKVQKKKTLIGENKQIQYLRKMIEKVKSSPVNIIITGETGTGKEVIARSLRGTDANGNLLPFVAIDSSTIQSTMAESLLFGHEKGAFTGADSMKKGAFEEANGGVIYFDEIANMPMEIQAKLLRVIQEKEVCRLGSSRVLNLDFRVICATNKCLETLVKEGKFKEDLYQRLNVVPLFVPPLRERIEDLQKLVDHFCELHASPDKQIFFSEEAMAMLKQYSWPGNVRELSNMVAYLTAVAENEQIQADDLPPKVLMVNDEAVKDPDLSVVSVNTDESFYKRVQSFEKQILTDEYKKHGGNISRMATAIKMDRSHLYTKLKAYKIHSIQKKAGPQGSVTTAAG